MKIFLALLLAQGVILTTCRSEKIYDESLFDYFFGSYCQDELKFPIFDDDNAAEAIRFAGT